MVLPLFAPGGVELAVVLVVSLLLFSPLVALAYVVLFRPDDDATEERVADLEAEVADLRERLDDRDTTEPRGGEAGGDGDGHDGDGRDSRDDDNGDYGRRDGDDGDDE